MDFKNLRKAPQTDPYYEEEPDWMEYKDREAQESLNSEQGVFAVKDKTSINTAPSVFERGVVFSTEKKVNRQ
ncbi:MAG: hypothetical protein K5770_20575 [Lachnospiraceae bacterium]|nr:hypothetical protein [Lachnospiraceae bacterium]